MTLLGSTTVSVQVAVTEDGAAASSSLLELSSSTFSVFGFTSSAIAIGFSSLLFWSEVGEEGLDTDDSGGGGSAATAMSSENIEMSWSSSSRSKPVRHSSRNGVSRNVMESLADRLWAPRRADEKSRNSSTHEGGGGVVVVTMVVVEVVGLKLAIEGTLW